MSYYIVIIIISFFVGFLETIHPFSKDLRDKMAFVLLLPMWFLAAFRSPDIGTDTIAYMLNYEAVSQCSTVVQALGYENHMERGYIMLVWICSKMGMSYLAFQVFIQTVLWGCFFYLSKKYALCIGYVAVAMMVGKWGGTCNVLRMYCAIAILSQSLPYIQKGKLFSFLFWVILAFLFHKSSLIFIIMYPLCRFEYKRWRVILIISGAILIAFLGSAFMGWMTDELNVYQNYVTDDRFGDRNIIATSIGFVVGVVTFLFYYYNGFFKRPQYSLEANGRKVVSIDFVFRMLFYVSFSFSIIGLSNNVMSRVGTYFSFFGTFTMTHVIMNIRNQRSRVVSYVLWMMYAVSWYLAVLILRPYWNQLVPYEFIWQ